MGVCCVEKQMRQLHRFAPLISTRVSTSLLRTASLRPIFSVTRNLRFFSTKEEEEALERQRQTVIDSEVVEDPSKAEAGKLPEEEIEPTVSIEEKEVVSGPSEELGFKAETLKLLHIVTHSLYSDKEVFIRELISNASDALEKIRQFSLTSKVADDYLPLEVSITADEANHRLAIQDFGVGMTKDELIENLGTIAHSGTVDFLKKIKEAGSSDVSNIIGQFGVGFYSVFMVADKFRVYSRSYDPDAKGYLWTSDGSGSYTISEASNVERGTKIVIELKDECAEFAKKQNIDNILKKYSNFVGFPIMLNGDRVNTVRALWAENKDKITASEHKEFYQFIAKAQDEPQYHLHFSIDTPMQMRALFYIGENHLEKYGMGRMEPGVSLFSRKVLIMPKAKGLLPDWLRFIKGVVDSEDVPLSISREHLQDQAIIRRLNTILTRRILKFLVEMSTKDSAHYDTKFWPEFNIFLKEGICSDFKWKDDIAKLVRFESSALDGGKLTGLEQYVSRMPEDQQTIYYLSVPSRDLALGSPYYEGFKKKGTEVLFLYQGIDDFVMSNIGEFNGKKLASIESSKVEQEATPETPDATEFIQWFKETLPDKVSNVKTSSRLVDTPAIVVDHETASFRRMMKMMDPERTQALPKQSLEVNVDHPIMQKLNKVRTSNPKAARLLAEQIFDNALIAAGLMDDARSMLPRMNAILEMAAADDK